MSQRLDSQLVGVALAQDLLRRAARFLIKDGARQSEIDHLINGLRGAQASLHWLATNRAAVVSAHRAVRARDGNEGE